MKSFKQHHSVILEFFDAIDGAVKHIDHLEENILNKGKQGVIEAISQIESSIAYFVDESDYKISTKFDGAPAIVAGLDTNGKFFVASKSAFAKNPKINYTDQDIIDNHGTGGLADKLKLALRYLPSLNIKGIYQMDYMFDPQMKIQETPQTIDGVVNENRFTTFTPNTIKYAVTENSPYGDEITHEMMLQALLSQAGGPAARLRMQDGELPAAPKLGFSDEVAPQPLSRVSSIPQAGDSRRKTTGTRRWTAEEDELLKTAVAVNGAKNWRKIAESFTGRTEVRLKLNLQRARPNYRAETPPTIRGRISCSALSA